MDQAHILIYIYIKVQSIFIFLWHCDICRFKFLPTKLSIQLIAATCHSSLSLPNSSSHSWPLRNFKFCKLPNNSSSCSFFPLHYSSLMAVFPNPLFPSTSPYHFSHSQFHHPTSLLNFANRRSSSEQIPNFRFSLQNSPTSIIHHGR